MNIRKLLVSGLCGVAVLSASRAMAVVNIDATFDPGASLSDFGFSGFGDPNPNTNVGGGVWNNALAPNEISYWSQPDLVNDFSGSVVHGFADVTSTTISTIPDDFTIVRLASPGDNYLARLGVAPGRFHLQTHPGGTASAAIIPLPNEDGVQHQYGWELDRSSRYVKLYFDGAQVGDPSGYSVLDASADPNNSFYLGDGTGGEAHTDIWDRVRVAEGAFPAPALVPGTRTSGLFSFGFGATEPSPNTWTTNETFLVDSATTLGDFALTPTVAGPMNSGTGPTFLDRILGNGNGSTRGGYGVGFSVQLDGTYTGLTPADAAANPNYQLTINVKQISIHGALFGDTTDTLGFNETTPDHAQSQTPQVLEFNGPVDVAAAYAKVKWNPSDHSTGGTSQTRTFDLSSTNLGNVNLDGLEVFATVTLTYDTIGGAQDDADFDGDNDVDGNDFLLWQRGVGKPNPTLADGDANDDNVVNGDDLAIWESEFGMPQTVAAAASIPEPGSLLLLGLSAAGVLLARRRARASN